MYCQDSFISPQKKKKKMYSIANLLHGKDGKLFWIKSSCMSYAL